MNRKKRNQDNCDSDMKNLHIAHSEESREETQVQYRENNQSSLDTTLNQNLLWQWIKPLLPFLKPGGRPVAIILALAFVSIFHIILGVVCVAPMLALGCTVVATISALENIIITIISRM